MFACLQNPDRTDELPATYAMRTDRHLKTLLTPFAPIIFQPPLVALAYWGVEHVVDDTEHAQRLRLALDELGDLPHGTLETLLRQSQPPLDRGLTETAECVLAWLTEYMQLAE